MGGMTARDQRHARRTIEACRHAGLSVVHPDDCTCSLAGRLVVLAGPEGLRLEWPYDQRCPIHSPLEVRDRSPAREFAPIARPHRGGCEAWTRQKARNR